MLLTRRVRQPLTAIGSSTTYTSGAAGLSMTAEDLWRFAQMLDNRGEFNGARLVSPATIDMMASNHVGGMFPGKFRHFRLRHRPWAGRRDRSGSSGGGNARAGGSVWLRRTNTVDELFASCFLRSQLSGS
jgi:CubicO group peptidase (beta-lactamase class C family)